MMVPVRVVYWRTCTGCAMTLFKAQEALLAMSICQLDESETNEMLRQCLKVLLQSVNDFKQGRPFGGLEAAAPLNERPDR